MASLSSQCVAAVIRETDKDAVKVPMAAAKHSADPLGNFEMLQNMWSDLARYDVIRGANAVFEGFYDRLNESEVSLGEVLTTLNNAKAAQFLRGHSEEATEEQE